MGVLVIPEGKTVLFRIAIFIGLGTVVTTIIYLTPVPDQYPQSCSRPCHELDWPMICRVKLTFERYQTLGGTCKDCPHNQSHCYHDTCITVDGNAKGVLTANRRFPGPTLQVCQHDIMVVDIVNRIPGQSFGVHWRGQPQSETPYMDGVPMITQCPIPSFTTFQYKFRASEAGTHMWLANTGEEYLDSLFGPLIVRQPDSKEVHRKLYDLDDMSNVVVIHTWNPDKANYLFKDETSKMKLLINGKTRAREVPPAVFRIFQGKRHRFRVLYMGGTENCQVRLSIDGHPFLVIALDGHPIQPKTVTAAKLFPGERLDFVLRGDQKPGSYYMRATPVETCDALVPTQAVIRYDEAEETVPNDADENASLRTGFTELETVQDEDCKSEEENVMKICLNDIEGAGPVPEEVAAAKPQTKLYLFHKSAILSKKDLINTTILAINETVKVPQTNNLTMLLPSSPLLSQSHEMPSDALCNNGSIPNRCRGSSVCECVHVVDVPLNDVVELVLVNQDEDDHVFHLHGYSFHVLGMSKLRHSKPEKVKHLDEVNKLVRRRFHNPVVKDTVAVVKNSVAVLRFKATNPGYWLLNEERAAHRSGGMSVVLHVGKKPDLTPIPKNFPKCGDWVGPEFFLV